MKSSGQNQGFRCKKNAELKLPQKFCVKQTETLQRDYMKSRPAPVGILQNLL
ncbi:hypothetical protein [Methanosarcina barkeri]